MAVPTTSIAGCLPVPAPQPAFRTYGRASPSARQWRKSLGLSAVGDRFGVRKDFLSLLRGSVFQYLKPTADAGYVFSGVAAAILAAVEGGILPPGKNAPVVPRSFGYACACSAGQDARLYGRRDARRYDAKHVRRRGPPSRRCSAAFCGSSQMILRTHAGKIPLASALRCSYIARSF